MIADALLKSGDASVVPRILTLVQQRPELRGAVIHMLGLYRITTEEALKLIHAGLQDPKSSILRVSLDAVSNLPQDVRKGFEPDVLRLVGSPDEDPQISQRARQVLLQ
jgi:hypothetical protein